MRNIQSRIRRTTKPRERKTEVEYLGKAMIYSIQTYLEDYFNRCGLADPDQYPVSLAKLYDRRRHSTSATAFLSAMKRIRTGFYRRNRNARRPVFEGRILTLLDGKFKKKAFFSSPRRSPKDLRLRASV